MWYTSFNEKKGKKFMKLFLFLLLIAMTTSNCFAQECCEPKESNILILYYSQTGVTKKVAEELQKQLGADIERLEVTKPYDGDFKATIGRCMEEKKKGELPHLRPLKSDLKKYDIIFLGYPIWFGTYATPVITLVNTFKFAGRQIVPFCTFGSGGLVESAEHLKKALPMASIQNGYGIREARIARVEEEVERFLALGGFIAGEEEIYPDYSEQKPVTKDEVEIFDAACSNYQFPLGTPITVGSRKAGNAIEYLYFVNGKSPDGRDIESKIYVRVEKNKKPEFTLVVR